MAVIVRTTTRLLMLGCGSMGGAMLEAWMRDLPLEVTVAKPSSTGIPEAASYAASPDAIDGADFDLLVIAVKPQMIAEAVPAYAGFLRPDGFVLSIAAGASTHSIASVVGTERIARLMPNLPARIGRGVVGAYLRPDLDAAQRALTEDLARAAGMLVPCDTEDMIDRVTALAGSGPGYVFEFARNMMDAGRRLGFADEMARRIVLETMAGSAILALGDERPLDAHRDAVMSRRGTTEAGVGALRTDGSVERLVADAVDAAYRRAVELRT